MITCCATAASLRLAGRLVLGYCFLWVSLLAAVPGAADDPLPCVVRVEEDWELVVGTPDPDSTAPQITCAFSPVGHVQSLHATFEVNHQSLPEFVSGGLQLQLWNGETPVSSRKFPQTAVLQQAGETVRWTQALQLADGELLFEIIGGSSDTWGNFGGTGNLKTAVSTELTSLAGYNPEVSVQNTGIGFASNRVQSLVLKRVRMVTDTGLVLESDSPLVVHQLD